MFAWLWTTSVGKFVKALEKVNERWCNYVAIETLAAVKHTYCCKHSLTGQVMLTVLAASGTSLGRYGNFRCLHILIN